MFNSYEELVNAVNERRQEELILEVDMANTYSAEHEEAKKALQVAEGLSQLTGKAEFLSDNMEALRTRVAETRPEAKPIWIRFRRMSLIEWAALTKDQSKTSFEQYETALPKAFIGVYATEDKDHLLSDDYHLLSMNGDKGILPGGAEMQAVVRSFIQWQNAGGEVSIRPTKSGQD